MTKQKRTAWLIGIGIAALLIGAKITTKMTTRAVTLDNPPRIGSALSINFYENQLTRREHTLYDAYVAGAENFEDGVITLPEPLTGAEAARAVQTFLYERPNDFYAMPAYLLGKNDVVLEEEGLETITEPVVYKAILFLSCSAFKESTFQRENGRIINLDECDAALRKNDAQKITAIRAQLAKTNALLQSVIDSVPKNAGQRETLQFYCDWIENNLKYDRDRLARHKKMFTEDTGQAEDLFNLYYLPSSLACTLEGKAMCVGFAKTLVYLCNQSGIEAHLVSGIVAGTNAGHAITAVRIGGKTAYIDLSGIWSPVEQDASKFRTEKAMRKILRPSALFTYRFPE